MNDTSISLSKALKLKSRLAGRIAKVTATITQYNSMVKGRSNEVDVLALDKERAALSDALVSLKTNLYEANRGIYNSLNQLAEKKGEIEFLNSLNTRHGEDPGYNGELISYVAVIKKLDVDVRVKKLEKEIDDLQDSIDKYNAEPARIRISNSVLELAS